MQVSLGAERKTVRTTNQWLTIRYSQTVIDISATLVTSPRIVYGLSVLSDRGQSSIVLLPLPVGEPLVNEGGGPEVLRIDD